jgi:TolB protein
MGCRRETTVSPLSASLGSSRFDLVYERIVAGNQDLYVAPAGGGPERRLTDDPATDGLPRYTRDGRAVLFASNRTRNFQLWEVPAEGGVGRRLRENSSTNWQADTSPDGARLALLSNIDGSEALFIVDRATGAARTLVGGGKTFKGRKAVLGNPHWSPDGGRIVFSSNAYFGHQVYLVDVATGVQSRISPLASGGCEPRFSPDGRKVVYVSRRLWKVRSRLVEHDLAAGIERVLVDWPALNYDPVYSPDGSELAFASNVTGEYVIYRQRLSDGQTWRVTHGPGPAKYPDYRPAR